MPPSLNWWPSRDEALAAVAAEPGIVEIPPDVIHPKPRYLWFGSPTPRTRAYSIKLAKVCLSLGSPLAELDGPQLVELLHALTKRLVALEGEPPDDPLPPDEQD